MEIRRLNEASLRGCVDTMNASIEEDQLILDRVLLYEASLSGCVDTLNALIEEDQLILDRVGVTWFHETPLHIAALHGHLDFTKALLNQKPKLATELDSLGRSPLHLASTEGYVEIVQELLSISLDMCHARDGDGRIPLHLAVMKRRVEVIKKLIAARPESTRESLDHGETILHLSVNCSSFEVLKLLVESVSDAELFNSQDWDGNTILHLSSILKQQEMVKYLLSRSGVEAINKNAMNKNGLTALDVLEHCPRDVKGMEILYLLREAGVRRASELIATPPPTQQDVAVHHHNQVVPKKMSKIKRWMKNLSRNYQGENWYEERQGTLMLVATVFACITFQAAINPPGGVWQEDVFATPDVFGSACREPNSSCSAGTSVLAYADPDSFQNFSTYNTISLIASLSIILLITSGFPLKNKFCMWLLILTMCTTVFFMTLAYLVAINMVFSRKFFPAPTGEPPGPLPTPIPTGEQYSDHAKRNVGLLLIIWSTLFALVGLIFVARFLYWLVKKLCKVLYWLFC